MVLGEFPMFMALKLRGGPVNVKEATKKKVGKPTELGAYRILDRLQDNSHETVNEGNPDRRDSETESQLLCINLPQTLLMVTLRHAGMDSLQAFVFELPLTAGEMGHVGLSLAQLKPKQQTNKMLFWRNRRESRVSKSYLLQCSGCNAVFDGH